MRRFIFIAFCCFSGIVIVFSYSNEFQKTEIVVENLPFSLNLIRTIGGMDVEDPHLAFNQPFDIAFDSSGFLYVLDIGNRHIQVLSPGGAYLKTISRWGQGPGEFDSPGSLDIDKEGKIYVYDGGSRRVQIFSPDGNFLSAFSVKETSSKIRCLSQGRVVLGEIRFSLVPKSHKDFPKLLEIRDSAGRIVSAFGELHDYEADSLNTYGNWIDLDTAPDGTICVSFRYQNRIEKYAADGRLVWKTERPLSFSTEPIDKGYIRITEKSRQIQGPTMNTCSNGIAVDGQGYIWVAGMAKQRPREQSESVLRPDAVSKIGKDSVKKDIYDRLELYDEKGKLLGFYPIPHPVHVIRAGGSSLFLVDLKEAKIYQYRIKENAGKPYAE